MVAVAGTWRTQSAVEGQSFQAHRTICLWLGHFYALLALSRWLLNPPGPTGRALLLNSLVSMGLFYGAGLLIHPLVRWLGALENFGLLLVGVALGNAVFLAAWVPAEIQVANFIFIQVLAGVGFRSTWRFALTQWLCVGLALFSLWRWVGVQALGGNLFVLLSSLLLSTMIWKYLNHLLDALSQLREKDRLMLRQRVRLIRDLRASLAKVRTLKGLIPICSHCKRVRDDAGFWQQVEAYVRDRSEAQFSHGICPSCLVDVAREFGLRGMGGDPRTTTE